jgi:hypothetical protein
MNSSNYVPIHPTSNLLPVRSERGGSRTVADRNLVCYCRRRVGGLGLERDVIVKRSAAEADGPFGFATMPSLIRLILALGLLSGLAYGAMFSLANFVEPKPREITITIPPDRLAKPR